MSSHVVSRTIYAVVFIALLVLLVLTVGVAWIRLGPLSLPVALVIAFFKTLLIVLFFMHVRYSSRLTQIFAAAGFLWLAIMIVLTMGDYVTRPKELPSATDKPSMSQEPDHSDPT